MGANLQKDKTSETASECAPNYRKPPARIRFTKRPVGKPAQS